MAIGNLAFPAEEVCPRGRLTSSQMTLQDVSGVGLCSEGWGTIHVVILATDATQVNQQVGDAAGGKASH